MVLGVQSGRSVGLVRGAHWPPDYGSDGRSPSLVAMSAARVSGWPSRLYKRLRFWDKLPNAKVLSEAERETAWDRIRTMRPAARQMFIDALIRQNARVAADIESVANRGTALLTATGVISGV